MDRSEEQTSFQMPDPTVETLPISATRCPVSDLLEDVGNCRQSINQELSIQFLSDPLVSLFSEQQKLRDVLDWTNRFLCSGSEICSTDGLIADMKEEGTTKISSKHSSAPNYHHPLSCDVINSEVFEGAPSLNTIWQSRPLNYPSSFCSYKAKFSYDLQNPYSFFPGTDEEPWSDIREIENMKSTEPQHATNEQTSSRDYHRTNRLHMSNQRLHTFTSGRSTNLMLALDTATHLIKESTSCGSNVICKKSAGFGEVSTLKLPLESNDSYYKRAEGVSENQKVQRKEAEQMEESEKGKIEVDRIEGKYRKKQESSSDHTHSQISHTEQTANSHFICHLKLPLNVTVYEQYQLCVAQLNHLRMRPSQHVKPESPEKEGTTSEKTGDLVKAPARPGSRFKLNSHTTNLEIKKQVNNRSKRVTAAENVEEGSSHATNKSPAEHRNAESCNSVAIKKTHADSRHSRQRKCLISAAQFDLTGKKHPDFMKETAEARASTDEAKPHDAHCAEENAAAVTNPGLLENKIRHHPDGMAHQRNLKGPKRRAKDRGSRRLTDNSSGERFPRCQQAIECTKKLDSEPNDRSKHVSPYREPAQTHTLHHDDPGLTSCERSVVSVSVDNSSNYRSAGVPVRDLWLCLPDEVWLSILSLLPHRDLCRVAQVCLRLNALASDHSLWKNLRIGNSALSDQCLLCVGRHCPRSVCLYSCSGLSVSFCGLQMFFSLCRNSLKELKVTSCTGPGLHGDQMLSAISQLCDHVTSVDVSWSGATDAGAKALRDCGKGLKSVVLNGCRVSDPPMKELVIKHKDSLCRLEVFGCQFLTTSWLQTVYEMCPGLEHLNIGRLPKITKNSLTALTARLKCLISLNVTGLQVTDTMVHTLLQNCVELQSLSFSSCPGVTDLTLHSISKYSPCIRSLDVSGCKAVTDAGVQSLALGCRRLQQLDLSSTSTRNRGYNKSHNKVIGLSVSVFVTSHVLHSLVQIYLHLNGFSPLEPKTFSDSLSHVGAVTASIMSVCVCVCVCVRQGFSAGKLLQWTPSHHQTEFLPHHLRENTEALPTLQEVEGTPSLWLCTSPH